MNEELSQEEYDKLIEEIDEEQIEDFPIEPSEEIDDRQTPEN